MPYKLKHTTSTFPFKVSPLNQIVDKHGNPYSSAKGNIESQAATLAPKPKASRWARFMKWKPLGMKKRFWGVGLGYALHEYVQKKWNKAEIKGLKEELSKKTTLDAEAKDKDNPKPKNLRPYTWPKNDQPIQ
tara:strand:+ start:412 stop:807 length:396 start_codon:yes stop_codon:yes gene_type:complete